VKAFINGQRFGWLKPFDGGELASGVEDNAEAAANSVTKVEAGEDTGRETDGAPVPGRGVNIGGNALIEFDPLFGANADIHNNLLHLILTFLSDYGFA